MIYSVKTHKTSVGWVVIHGAESMINISSSEEIVSNDNFLSMKSWKKNDLSRLTV